MPYLFGLFVAASLFLSFTTQAQASGSYYIFDAQSQYLNRRVFDRNKEPLCTRNSDGFLQSCSLPPGKTFQSLMDDYDTYMFLSSTQGIVNRYRPTFYLLSSEVDQKWIDNLKAHSDVWPWFAAAGQNNLQSIDEVISTFFRGYGIQGSVVWDADRPFTLNLAMTIAGADNLVVVRRDSTLYNKITAAYPVKVDLAGRFNTKPEAYRWLADNYLATGKVNPNLAYIKDGYPVYLYKREQLFDFREKALLGWGNLISDYIVAKKGFIFDLAPSAENLPKDDFGTDSRADFEVLQHIVNIARNKVGENKLIEFWGYPTGKYNKCNSGGREYEDGVLCSEWRWSRNISEWGGVKRLGGGEQQGVDSPNMSFFAHGPGVDFLAQNASLTPRELIQKGYARGFPYNFSFENDSAGGNWTLDTSNKAVYSSNGSHGRNYLEANVASADLQSHNSVYQDIARDLWRGYRYNFQIKIASVNGGTLRGRQVVWAFREGRSEALCERPFTVSGSNWQTLDCGFDTRGDGFSSVRLQVYLDTVEANYRFDEAYFDGPNMLEVNPNMKFATVYMGDYDFANAPQVMSQLRDVGYYDTNASGGVFNPAVWYAPPWDSRRDHIPVGWGISSVIAKETPPVFAYLAKTKGAGDWFVMPDSGAGYVNPGHLKDSVLGDWIRSTGNLHRQFNYSTGWVLEGLEAAHLPNGNTSEWQKIVNMYKIIAPGGIFYDLKLNAGSNLSQFVNGLGVVWLGDLGWQGLFEGNILNHVFPENIIRMALKEEGEVSRVWCGSGGRSNCSSGGGLMQQINENRISWTDILNQYLPEGSSSAQFLALRAVYLGSSLLDVVFNGYDPTGAQGISDRRPDIKLVDPITFFNLQRQTYNAPTVGRASIVSHNIPTYLTTGQNYDVSLTLRNDGWDTWVGSDGNNCGGYGDPAQGCYVFAWGLQEGEVMPTGKDVQPEFPYSGYLAVPGEVKPRESITFNFTLSAPQTPGRYSFQTDMVKNQVHFFEEAGGVPWQKPVEVVVKQVDFNGDGSVGGEEIDQVTGRYGESGGVEDVNGDGEVNIIDLQKIILGTLNNP